MTKVVLPANFTADELKHMREAGKILAGLYRDVRREGKGGGTGATAERLVRSRD